MYNDMKIMALFFHIFSSEILQMEQVAKGMFLSLIDERISCVNSDTEFNVESFFLKRPCCVDNSKLVSRQLIEML